MTTTSISYSRYRELDQIILVFLARFPSDTVPIKLTEILKQLSLEGMYFNTFKQFAETNNIPLALVPSRLKTKNACLKYNHDTGDTYIYYNQDLPKSAKRWDLVHEIGHHTLGHYRIIEANSGSLSKKDFGRFEEEANYFAKQVLAPDSLVLFIMSCFDKVNMELLYMIYRSLFELGKQASLYSALHMYGYYKHKEINLDLLWRYSDPINQYLDKLSTGNTLKELYDQYELEIQCKREKFLSA